MKLWLDNIQKILICITLLLSAVVLHAEEIDPTDVSYVTVNPYTNEVSVCWYKSKSANIKYARILYIYDETTLIKGKGIVDVPGNEDNTFVFKTDSISLFSYEANEKPMSLAVDAYSENGNNSTSLREYHTTMVASADVTRCPSRIKLSWTHYFGYGITIEKYEIVEVIEETETVLQECSSKECTCFIDLNENPNRQFFVRAVFNDCRGTKRTSTSCMCEISEISSTLPKFIDIENISIENNTDISMVLKYDVASDYRNYVIYKSENDTNHFIGIDTLYLKKTDSEIYDFVDVAAFKQDTATFYKTAVFDECGLQIKQTKPITPITAEVHESEVLTNLLEWSQNTSWENISQYKIWRSQDGESEQLIDSIDENHYLYFDELDEEYTQASFFCYRVETIHGEYSSFTNSVCLNKKYKLLIPNAINPYSDIEENRIFKPKYAFITGSYKMNIIDRFGNCIFTSTNIDNGWDGKVKDSYVPTGTYQYKISIVLPNGENIERIGVVNVIYN